MLVGYELRRHVPVMGALFVVLVLSRLISSLGGEESSLSAVFGLAMLLCWAMATLYVLYDISVYYLLGRQLLLHISSLSRLRVMLLKAGVLGGYLIVLSFASIWLSWSYVASPRGDSGSLIDGLAWAGGRLLSIVAFLGVALLMLVVAKSLRRKGPMIFFFSLSIAALPIALGFVYWQLGHTAGSDFFIGVSNAYEHLPAYVLLVPIYEYGPGALVGQLFWTSTIGNALIVVVAYPILFWLTQRQRANFYRL